MPVYLYIASGTGLSPDIAALRFYDSGTTANAQTVYHSEETAGNQLYSLFFNATAYQISELQPDAMVVEDAGTAAVEGVYLRDGVGDVVGFPKYLKGDYRIEELVGTPEAGYPLKYAILGLIDEDYYQSISSVTEGSFPSNYTYEVTATGAAPAPTVRRATWADIDAAGIDRATVAITISAALWVGGASLAGAYLAEAGTTGTVTIAAYAVTSFLESLAGYATANIADLDTIIGDRLYPVQAPQNVALPFGVFTQISGDENIHHGGKSGWGSMRVQYDFYSTVFHEVHDAARALRAEFEGRSVTIATHVESCFARVETEFDSYDSEERIYRRTLDLLFEYFIAP